jgi:hypothetical protein
MGEVSPKGDLDECLQPYEDLRLSIATIEHNIDAITELKQRSNKEVKDDVQRGRWRGDTR